MAAEFKDRLKEMREFRGLTQADLAKKTGLQPAAVSHFETGQRSPSFDNLRKLADALAVSSDFLLGRIDEREHGKGFSSGPRAQQLFRHAEKLSDEGIGALEDMAAILAEREKKKREGK